MKKIHKELSFSNILKTVGHWIAAEGQLFVVGLQYVLDKSLGSLRNIHIYL